ncbi:UbiX family flavin prenyltransferase [Desulfosporosinus sp. FKB]|uniref:UbiX family flavin prenyltransferase n=1 Tax=Desulfosporosinus sp. FKB TaxID=1969835 RepID=UPI000B4A02BA|nr:UbiX family flavin prenyltransferase [Desulfosporosinus sp. FKB]
MKIIVGLSGASGAILGVELLRALQSQPECETHLVISDGAQKTLSLETDLKMEELIAMADYYYDVKNMAASIASGSFTTDGMIIIPCSMKTLSAVVQGYADNLLVRAADVCLKENRRIVLVPREAPFNRIHLKNLLAAADLGCTIIPPVLTFYNYPQTIHDQINHITGKILRQFGLEHSGFKPWAGEGHVTTLLP